MSEAYRNCRSLTFCARFSSLQKVGSLALYPIEIAGLRASLWFDTSVFSAPANNEWGNVERRGLLTGPAYYNLDASIVKVIRVGTKRAEIRADFFNALNIAHYANPNGTLGNANFGRITAILAQTERTIRFGGRFLF